MQNNEIETQPGCCEDELNTGLLTVTEARARILDSVTAVDGTESLPVREALGRVLAVDIVSPIDVPSHTNSAMDGYAVRAEDLPAEGVREFPVPGTSWAGRPWLQPIESGQSVQIMTGGMMPEGADTVVMQEHVERDGDTVRIGSGHKPGQNVRSAGEDLAAGQAGEAGSGLSEPVDELLSWLGRDLVLYISPGIEDSNVARDLGPLRNDLRILVARVRAGDEGRPAYEFTPTPLPDDQSGGQSRQQYLYAGKSVSGFPLRDFTISVLCYPLNEGSLIGSGQAELWPREWRVTAGGFVWAWTAGRSSGAVGRQKRELPFRAQLARWQHICITRRGPEICAYLNGQLKSRDSAFPRDSLPVYSHGLMVGNMKADTKGMQGRRSTDYTRWEPYRGMIEKVAIVSRCLTPSEVQRLDGDLRNLTQ